MEIRTERQPACVRDELEKVYGKEPHTIYVLGGGVRRIASSDRFMSTSFSGSSDKQNNGAFFRMYAAADLAKIYPQATVITSGYAVDDTLPSSAVVMESELMTQGVSQDRIQKRLTPNSTGTEMVEVLKTAAEISRQDKSVPLWVCTNSYHIPRAKKMHEYIKNGDIHFLPVSSFEERDALQEDVDTMREILREQNVRTVFVSAEQVIALFHPAFNNSFKKIRRTDHYEELILSEMNGIADLRLDRYKQRNIR